MMTEVHFFAGKEGNRIYRTNGKSFAKIIGIPNAVSVLFCDTGSPHFASFFRSTDLTASDDCTVWSFWSRTEFLVGPDGIEMKTPEFLDWLGIHYPEDLEMFLWHPEIWEERFDP